MVPSWIRKFEEHYDGLDERSRALLLVTVGKGVVRAMRREFSPLPQVVASGDQSRVYLLNETQHFVVGALLNLIGSRANALSGANLVEGVSSLGLFDDLKEDLFSLLVVSKDIETESDNKIPAAPVTMPGKSGYASNNLDDLARLYDRLDHEKKLRVLTRTVNFTTVAVREGYASKPQLVDDSENSRVGTLTGFQAYLLDQMSHLITSPGRLYGGRELIATTGSWTDRKEVNGYLLSLIVNGLKLRRPAGYGVGMSSP